MLLFKSFSFKFLIFLYFCAVSTAKDKKRHDVKKSEGTPTKSRIELAPEFAYSPNYGPSLEGLDVKEFEDLGVQVPVTNMETFTEGPREVEITFPKLDAQSSLTSSNNLRLISSDEDDDSNDGIKSLDSDDITDKESSASSTSSSSSSSNPSTFTNLMSTVTSKISNPLIQAGKSIVDQLYQKINSPSSASSASSASSLSSSSTSGSSASPVSSGQVNPTQASTHRFKNRPYGTTVSNYFRASKRPKNSNAKLSEYSNEIDQMINSQLANGDEDPQSNLQSETSGTANINCKQCPGCHGCQEAVIKISIPVDCLKCPDCSECNNKKPTENLVTNCCPKSVISIGKDNCPLCPVFDLTFCRAFSRDVEEKSGVNFLVEVGIIQPWDEEMLSQDSQKFQTIRRKIQDLVLKTYVDHPTYQDTLVLSLKSMKGITVAECLVRFSKPGKGDMQRLFRAFTCGCGCELIDNSVLMINFINNTELIGRCPAACLVPSACSSSSFSSLNCDPSCCSGKTIAVIPVNNIIPVQPIQPIIPAPFPGAISPLLSNCGPTCPAFCMPLCSPECCAAGLGQFRRATINTMDWRKKFNAKTDAQK